KMIMSDESWYVVRNTPGVTSFVGSGNKPVPLQENELKSILKQVKQEPTIRVEFQLGESVRDVDGPFAAVLGEVDEINAEKGKATPAPPVGTVLRPHGRNIMEFTRAYNERTAAQAGDVVPAEITIFEDRSFSFVLKTPPTVNLLKKAAGIEKGSPSSRKEKVGTVTRQQLVAIAETKAKDLTSYDVEHALRMIEGTARS